MNKFLHKLLFSAWVLLVFSSLFSFCAYYYYKAYYTFFLQGFAALNTIQKSSSCWQKASMTNKFSPVNRTTSYLRDAAVLFAQEYDLEDSVFELYQKDEWHDLKKKKSRRRVKKNPKKKSSFVRNFRVRESDPRFILPIDPERFWLSSPFGPRKNPNGTRGFHSGIDMAALKGTPIKAAGDGVVSFAGNLKGYGKAIIITHDKKYKTRYGHLSVISTTSGKKVKTGDIIGKVGSTGTVRSTGKNRDPSHLHFEVEVYGKRVNPFYFLK